MLGATPTSPRLSRRLSQKRSGWKLAFRLRDVLALVLATAYAIALVSLPFLVFRDRDNYLVYASASDVILQRFLERGILPLLSNEPVWLLINVALARMLPPDDVVRVIIAVPAFAVAWMTLRARPGRMVWLLLFLLYPAVVKNHIIHLRQGVAVALFLAGMLLAQRRGWRWLLIGLTPFIHSSFFFVLGILLLAHLSRRLRFAADLSMLVFVLATLAIVLSLEWAATALGARQASEYELRSGLAVSGANFVFWGAMLGIMTIEGREFLRRHRFEIAVIFFYLGTYFFTPITARVFESALLLVLIAGLALTRWRGPAFRFAVVAFGVLQWAGGYWAMLIVP